MPPPFLLKSSSWAKLRLFAMSGCNAGGYWPTQYQLPGASQTLFFGSANQSLDSCEMLSTLYTLMRPYLVVCTSWKSLGCTCTPLSTLCFTALYSNDLAIISVGL